MINETHVCVNGEYLKPLKNLKGPPMPGKKISIQGEPLEIRCSFRYHDDEKTILYIDLIGKNMTDE